MRKRFLTVYSYGTGGNWQWITADSAEDIKARFPELTVMIDLPAWWAERGMQRLELRTYDIDSESDAVLKLLGR